MGGVNIIAEILCMVSFAVSFAMSFVVYCFLSCHLHLTSYITFKYFIDTQYTILTSVYYFYVLFILWQVPQNQDTSKDTINKILANNEFFFLLTLWYFLLFLHLIRCQVFFIHDFPLFSRQITGMKYLLILHYFISGFLEVQQ